MRVSLTSCVFLWYLAQSNFDNSHQCHCHFVILVPVMIIIYKCMSLYCNTYVFFYTLTIIVSCWFYWKHQNHCFILITKAVNKSCLNERPFWQPSCFTHLFLGWFIFFQYQWIPHHHKHTLRHQKHVSIFNIKEDITLFMSQRPSRRPSWISHLLPGWQRSTQIFLTQ